MKKIVVKFGGSNLKTKEDIQKIINTVKHYNRPLVIVVSAFYGVTNFLTKGLTLVSSQEDIINEICQDLFNKKEEAIFQHISSEKNQNKALSMIQERLDQLKRNLLGVHYIEETPHFMEDKILSYGERLSSLLLSLILQENGIEACEALPEDMGLYTDGAFSSATINFKKSAPLVKEALKEDKVYVVPGFYGISEEGKITLLGRGGSDYSAAGIAKCVEAESLDIWKDVDGYLSADPKSIKNPIKLSHLCYKEAAELSYFGAKILHPRTAEPLLSQNIPIRLFNIDRGSKDIKPLTIIGPKSLEEKTSIKSVTSTKDFAILKITDPGVGLKLGALARFTSALDRGGINIKSVVTSQTAINFYLEQKDLKPASLLIKNLGICEGSSIKEIDNVAIISLVGNDITSEPLVADRMLKALANKQIKTLIVSMGASDVAAYAVILEKDIQRALQAVHKEFFEKN